MSVYGYNKHLPYVEMVTCKVCGNNTFYLHSEHDKDTGTCVYTTCKECGVKEYV
jgi:RNase P subunit RPR2